MSVLKLQTLTAQVKSGPVATSCTSSGGNCCNGKPV
ncbi:class III lanthipeptide [Lentzea sp. NPDC054927]